MSGSVNKVILVGNLGADPEIRRTQDGRAIANFNLATSETWRDRTSGERRERTEWHRIVVFTEGLAKIAEQFLKKGMKVYVEGQLQTRKWQDQSGQDRYTTEVVLKDFGATLTMLDSAGSGRPPPASSPDDYGRPATSSGGSTPRSAPQSRPPAGQGGHHPDLDDEIPF